MERGLRNAFVVFDRRRYARALSLQRGADEAASEAYRLRP
jgi:hypothetical protein